MAGDTDALTTTTRYFISTTSKSFLLRTRKKKASLSVRTKEGNKKEMFAVSSLNTEKPMIYPDYPVT